MTGETKPKPIKDPDADLPKKEWCHPVRSPRVVSDDFAEHKARKSLDPGTDYVKGRGSVVRAIHRGVVFVADRNPDGAGGRMVYIDHGHGLVTRYLHLSNIRVRPGVRVLAGTIIGEVGGSGFGKEDHYGDHLHLSVLRDGVHRDPEVFLKRRLSR